MSWMLDATVSTPAGKVAAGSVGDGPPLVLAHGWPWSSYSWHRIIPALARRHRVHWYDMPGYGRSEKGAGMRTSLVHGPTHIHRAVVDAYIRGAMVGELDDADVEALVAPWITAEGRESFYEQFAQADERFTREIEGSYGDIRCPVRILWGELDPWIPLERGRELHRLVPQASFEVLPGVGHLPQLDAPELVVSRVGAPAAP